MDDDIMQHLDDAIDLTFTLLLFTVAALIVVTYLEQRAQVCYDTTFVLRLYSSRVSRLWREAWHGLLCI